MMSTRSKTVYLFLVVVVIFLNHGPPAIAQGQSIRVACLGDSITAGARVDAKTESYPARLQKLLGDDFKVQNFGIGGATLIKTGRPNVWRSLDSVKKFEPNFVIISLGTNDTVGGNRKNWEKIDRFDADYSELINTLSNLPTKPKIVVCTPTAMVLETPGLSEERLANLKERKPRLQELCRRIRLLAKKHKDQNVSLLELNDVLKGKPELVSKSDGVHPNAKGYLAIAKAVATHVRPKPKQPNIIMFLVDDMGWQDTSVPFHTDVTDFNRRYRTPNMQKLAKRGMKFTQAYACSVCSPTRVSLMTGLNAARHRVTNWTLKKNASNDRQHEHLSFPKWNVNGLSPEPGIERTIHAKALPSFLSEVGYRTIHVGKAHFGAIGTPASDPINVGFDVNIGGHAAGGPGSFLGTQNFSAAWRKGDRVWDVPGLESYHGKEVFLTEALTLEANKAVDQAVADGKPFFLYMSHYAVHVPFAVDSRFYQKYRDQGLDKEESMYAAMVEGMDKSLGDILANINRHGLADNTVVMFMSDNGGLSASGRGGKRNTHNKPLSSGKGSAHEGGVRVPMIVLWPGVTKAASVCRQPVIIEDFFSTILELAGVSSVKQIGGVIDGLSFVNLLRGQQDPMRDERRLFWHFPNNWGPRGPGIGPSSAMRFKNWKLIYYHETQSYELFDLNKDLGEANNLAEQMPELRDQLAADLGSYLKSVDAQMPRIKSTGQRVPYPTPVDIQCEGRYQHHLQGICTDEKAIYWSFTTALVKTDMKGKLLKKIPVANHHGDLCFHDGKLYVAVNLGKFNDPKGNADSWVYVYDSDSLKELARHETQEVFHGAGGIGFRNGHFFVVGGLPDTVNENYVYEYDSKFNFLKKHVIKSGHTHLGIQTATFAHDRWWFGCYGDPKILLVTDPEFKMIGRYKNDCSLGIEGTSDGVLLVASGRCDKNKGCDGKVQAARPDRKSGFKIKKTN